MAAQVATASLNQPAVQQVINKPTLGRKPDETNDPEIKEIQEALSDIYLLKKKRNDVGLDEDEINELKKVTKLTNKYYTTKPDQKIIDEPPNYLQIRLQEQQEVQEVQEEVQELEEEEEEVEKRKNNL